MKKALNWLILIKSNWRFGPMKTVLWVVALALLAISANAQVNAETEIRKVMADQAAAWNRGDIDGFMTGYWKSESMTFVSGDKVTRGWNGAIERYKKNYSTREKMGNLTFDDLEITILSRNSAVVLGSWSLSRTGDSPHGKFTLIFRKFKKGWRIVHDHTS